MSNVFDDITTRFKSFSDTIDKSLTSIDFASLIPRTKADGKQHLTPAEDAAATLKARQEKEAARQRGELILQQLPQAYFDQSFDPLEYELRQMGDETKQDDIDGVVDRLAAAVEVVSVRLAKHVIKNQDKLIAGITTVTQVEDDLKAAHVICKGTRSQLKMAAEEVQRQIKVITCTRKKQAHMEVLEVVSKVKRVKDLQQALRKVHEEGDLGEAILLCVDCFQAVETLGAYKVAPELQITVQRHYYDTLQRLDTALQNECGCFTAEGYSKLLEAYLLQGLPGPALAGKVLSCFKESINDAAMRLVRSMVLAKAAFSSSSSSGRNASNSSGGGGSDGSSSSRTSYSGLGDCSFEELCKQLSSEMVQPCLKKLLEVVFELLSSYHLMAQWHKAGVEQQAKAAAAAAAAVANDQQGSSSSNGSSACEPPGTPSQAQLDQVQAATRSLLEAVSTGLAESRVAVLDVAASRVKELLSCASKCKGDDFPKVVESCLHFISVGEAFAGCSLALRASLVSLLGSCVEIYHKSNMDALKLSLALEDWQPISASDAGGVRAGSSSSSTSAGACLEVGCMKQSLSNSPYLLPAYGQPDSVVDFAAWVQSGNPFKVCSRAVGGQSVLPATAGQATARPTPQPAPPSAAGSTSSSRVATKSSMLVLRWLNSYAALMAPLPARQAVLWASTAELFDNFLLACFILFSGVSLETLVWQDDQLPHRLRSALLRVTTSPGCKYKAQVEELQRTKPAAPLLATPSSSLLDFGFSGSSSSSSRPNSSSTSTSSKLDAFTKKFKDTMVELINTDLSQPLPGSSSSSYSPHSNYAAHSQQVPLQQPQQQQQQRAVPSAQQPGGQQQQQQRRPDSSAVGTAGTAVQSAASPSSGSSGSSPVRPQAGAGYSMTHEGMQYQVPGPAGRPLGLKERAVAIESLTAIADALKAAKPALLAQLGTAGMSKEVEGYLARTVDAAQDLRDAIYRGGAKQLLTGVTDPDRGTAAQIAACNYAVKEPATRYQPWAEALVKQYRAFNDFIGASGLPPDVQLKMWEAAVKLGCDSILDGLGRVGRCTLEGRAGMSLDLSAVEKGLRPIAPSSALASLRLVDNYIKAFYIPWDDLARWAQIHLAEYGKAKILVLVEVMAEAYGIKRAQKAALIDKLNAELAEFA